MKQIERYLAELKRIFKSAKNKHEANFQSKQLMAEMSGDNVFLTEVLAQHLKRQGSLNTKHYPVVGIDIDLNEDFGLVANCWIPLPDRSTNCSTKAIHHHGDMLLTTATAFGTGYEHWLFQTPVEVDSSREVYSLKLLEKAPHPRNHVAFVDAYIAHLPMYPPDLTITYALWSNRFKTSWRDKVKRNTFLHKNRQFLKRIATTVGVAKQLDIKVVEYFDFYPTSEGFRGMKDRKEFERSNNEDYLASLFHVIQETGNEALRDVVRQRLELDENIENRELVVKYLKELESGNKIEGRLSSNHYNVECANFTSEEIVEALAVQK